MQVRFSLSIVLRAFVFLTLVLTFASLASAQSAGRSLVTQAVDNSVRTSLSGNVHPLARAEFDRGEAPLDMPLRRMLLVLKRSPEQETALRSLIDGQQDKSSPNYHKWMTPEEFGARFGLSDSDLAVVTNWLRGSGFEVSQVSKGRTFIEFSGTAGMVKEAFGTAIHKFVGKGEEHWANANDPSIPTALAPVVSGLDSLHNFQKKAQNRFVGTYSETSKKLTSPQPDFTFNGGCTQNGNCYAVVPYDFAAIYDLLPLWNATPKINGTGQTIAIVGRTAIDPTDPPTFWGLFGLDGVNAPQPTLVITPNGPMPDINGDEAEADIDIQWSGAAAPGATINFVTSASTETTDGVDLSALYIVDNNLAPVMSESYGQCELGLGQGGVDFYGSLWAQAAVQGITAMVSTGDNGAAGCDDPGSPAQFGLNVNGLSSTPYNVAVGGTDFNQFTTDPLTYWNQNNDPITQRSAKGYIPETTWNDSCANPLFQFVQGGTNNAETNCNNPSFSNFLDSEGGSGGQSLAWLKPSWQTGTPSDNSRDQPDVSLFASNGFLGSFYVVCVKDMTGGQCNLNNFAGFGGTSVASPAFAGIMALVNQKWGVQGNPNFVLYKLPAKKSTAFHDVPSGSTIAMPCFRGSTDCTTLNQGHQFGILAGFGTSTNYDLATGLGSVDANVMVTNWNLVTFTATATTLTLNSGNPVNITHGAAVPVTVSVNPTAATGNVALLVSPGTPGDPGIDWNTLASGTKTWSTNLLPGGTYKVIAHYEGDNARGGNYSAPSADVTVNPENSSVYMPGLVTGTDSNGNPVYTTSVPYGSSYLLRADVLNSQGNFCTTETLGEIACPTGTVSFTDNGNPLDAGTYKLNSLGYTEDQLIQLPGGAHTVVGTYSGDNSYKTSFVSSAITVTRATTSINYVNASGAWLNVNQPFSIRSEVISGSLGVPEGGTFTFLADGVPVVGTVHYTFSGNCGNNFFVCLDASIDNVVFSTPGVHTIAATYNGDTNYAPSSSAPVNISAFYSTTTTLSASPANPPAGSSTTLTALIDTPAKNLTPTGGVSFSYYGGAGLPGTVTLTPVTDPNGNSALQATLSYSPTANHTTIAAVYTGDSNYLQSGSGPFDIVVAGNDFSFTPAVTTAVVPRGQTIAIGLGVDGQLDYNATLTFDSSSCKGLPPLSTASFSPTSITGSGGTTLFIATTGPNALLQPPSGNGLRWWFSATGGVFAAVFLFGDGRRRRRSTLLSMMACILLAAGVACGGGGGNGGGGGGGGGTPTGTYSITVSATDGTHTHTASFKLIVQ